MRFLRGVVIPIFPIHFKDTARQVLEQVEYAMQNQQVLYINYNQPWQAYILPIKLTPTGVLWQNGSLLQIHLSVSPVKVLKPYFEVVACLIQRN